MTKMKMLDTLRKRLRPSHDKKAIEKVLQILQEKISKVGEAKVVAGGSFVKGTSIKGNHDIDVFIKFPKGTINLSELIAKAVPKATRLHGSRDYFQIKRAGYVFELIPVLDITDWHEAQNVTDMSPLHVTYAQAHLTEAMRDDVRLAKQFCKAAGVYGAESYIKGFSGHVLELLIIRYKSFEKLLKAAASWNGVMVIDLEKHYPSSDAAVRRLNEAKTLSPLIIIDPVQPERNAAAALSQEALNTFKERAAAFLKKHNKIYFDIKINKQAIKKQWKKNKVLFVAVRTPKGKPDVIGCRLLSKHDTAKRLFAENGFSLIYADWRYEEKQTLAWYVLKEISVGKLTEQIGPPATMKEAVDAFRRKHTDTYLRNGRWYTKVKRKFTKASAVLKAAWR